MVGMLVSAPEITREGCQQNLAWLANEARLQKESLGEFQGRDLWVYVSQSEPGKESCSGTIIWKFEPRSYLGPQKPYSECGEDEPVAACPKDSHEEGRFVLLSESDGHGAIVVVGARGDEARGERVAHKQCLGGVVVEFEFNVDVSLLTVRPQVHSELRLTDDGSFVQGGRGWWRD